MKNEKECAAGSTASGSTASGSTASGSSRARVLIVDDDEHLIGNLTLWLERQNIEVLKASDGHQAFEILRDSAPVDLVLTDFMMPNLNGLELLRLLKSNPRLFDTKVLVMSNNSNFEFRKRAIENGAVDYVLKEIGAREIIETVMRACGIARPSAASILLRNDAVAGKPGLRSPENAPAEELLRLKEIAIFTQGLLDLLRVARQVDALPSAAQSALESVERVAVQIQDRASPGRP